MKTRIPALVSPPIAFAHRGARAHAAENTLDAFALAKRLGATGLETDAWRTADGEIVLDHDGVVRRFWVFATPMSELARPDLPHHVPTLRELYETCGTELPLSVDLKAADVFDGVVGVAREFGAASNLWICHEDLEQLVRWREIAPDVRLVNSIRRYDIPGSIERRASDLARSRIDAINMRRPDWNGGLTTLFHRFEVRAFGWDAQHESHIGELVDMGIDAVYGDHVDRMVDVIARFYPPTVRP